MSIYMHMCIHTHPPESAWFDSANRLPAYFVKNDTTSARQQVLCVRDLVLGDGSRWDPSPKHFPRIVLFLKKPPKSGKYLWGQPMVEGGYP